MDTTEVEARKLAQAERQLEADIELRKAELALKREDLDRARSAEVRKPIWNTAAGLAILGGLITFLTAIVSNHLQSRTASQQREEEHRAQLVLERQKFQANLIQQAIERPETIEDVAVNLNFLWEAGLIPDYKDIPKIVKSSGALTSESPTLPSGATFGVPAAGIVGLDDRVRIANTTDAPYNAICSLTIRSANGKGYVATGFLVSPRVVLTTGYTVYMDKQGGYVSSVTVIPGRNGRESPFGTYTSTQFEAPQEWIEGENPEYNIGAIFLDKEVSATTPVEIIDIADQELQKRLVRLAGYAGDKTPGQLWESAGQVERVTPSSVGYSLDTYGGMGGAPLITSTDKTLDGIIGIHVGSGDKFGLRLNGVRLEQVKKWIEQGKALPAVPPMDDPVIKDLEGFH